MASDDKEYEQSALGKRVNELMDDGYDFGEAVKQAMSEGLKNGGSVGIEILFKNKMADGGRVGLFMGGDPLTGQALSIYNSMNSYGFSDQEIANALEGQGYYTPPGSGTPDTPPTTIQPIGFQSGNNDNAYAGQVVDQTDYGFNKKNYAPGKKLEINPAAFGVSFPKQPSGPKREGIINQAIDSFTSLPTRSLSQFTSPGTGGVLKGPAEQGFMGQTLDIDPAGRTREEIRSLYDNYNRFLGRTSNFADARVKGKAGQVLGSLVGAAAGIPFVGKGIDMLSNAFGPAGDKSLQSKYTVDNAGYGSTGARDEFGLATFNKKDGFLGLTGNTTRDYTDRMNERLGELDDFFSSRIEGFDINNLDDATLNQMSKINGFYTKQIQAYKQRTAVEDINKRTQDAIEAEKERQKQIELQKKIAAEAAAGKSLSQIGKENFTGEGMAFEAGNTDAGGGFTGGKTVDSPSTPGGKYSSPRKDGGLMFARGGLATMFKEKR